LKLLTLLVLYCLVHVGPNDLVSLKNTPAQ